MAALQAGGGSSAVAASAHAACERFRNTDPLVIGISRRQLAKQLGHPDTTAGIPDARWVRAMTFERLVHHERFVSQLLTKAVGELGLDRPRAIRRVDCAVSLDRTTRALAAAHRSALNDAEATMLTGPAVPFVGLEDSDATPVKPDFAIVAPRAAGDETGTWLIMGDAKDYERVRSRIDDGRMLKGFLQVALGAESAAAWSALPADMHVHRWGALAVPRNAFLQPEAVVECLDDHRSEVSERATQRTELLAQLGTTPVPESELDQFVAHLEATFDPGTCPSCAMFNLCRSELRASHDPIALLTEIGVPRAQRAGFAELVQGGDAPERSPASVAANIDATVKGLPVLTGQRRSDPAGLPGSINVVLAKSDSAALGIHGIGVQRVEASGPTEWAFRVFEDPQASATRLAVLGTIGEALASHLDAGIGPLHLVVTESATADVLASIADSIAGVETSRLRWARDLEAGRPALTFDGEPARVPDPLDAAQRLAVSFLLEEDRARALSLRSLFVELLAVLARHVVPGGPSSEQLRLDYLLEWAEATKPLDHRAVSDDIATRIETPGARLSNVRSNELFAVQPSGGALRDGRSDPALYEKLLLDELGYKAGLIDRTLSVLDRLDDSVLRSMHRELEADAQEVWGRRRALHASDLVRFGRTSRWWRNDQVAIMEADRKCNSQLLAVGNPQAAHDLAVDAGTREVALATVTALNPIRLDVASRRLGDRACVVALHHNGSVLVESPDVKSTIQKGSFKFERLPGAVLTDDGHEVGLLWEPQDPFDVAVGDQLIVADQGWLGGLNKPGTAKIDRPKADTSSAPKKECDPGAFEREPDAHQWCCKPHEVAEAEWSDTLAERRARGELNPDVWPPVIDSDRFDTAATDAPVGNDLEPDTASAPADLTMDDLD